MLDQNLFSSRDVVTDAFQSCVPLKDKEQHFKQKVYQDMVL